MLNLFQHLKIRDPETILKQVQHMVQGDKYLFSHRSSCLCDKTKIFSHNLKK